MAWWEKFPEAWDACQVNQRDPEEVMREFTQWLEELPGLPLFTAWPAT